MSGRKWEGHEGDKEKVKRRWGTKIQNYAMLRWIPISFFHRNYKLWSFCADKQNAVLGLWTRPHNAARNVEQQTKWFLWLRCKFITGCQRARDVARRKWQPEVLKLAVLQYVGVSKHTEVTVCYLQWWRVCKKQLIVWKANSKENSEPDREIAFHRQVSNLNR